MRRLRTLTEGRESGGGDHYERIPTNLHGAELAKVIALVAS